MRRFELDRRAVVDRLPERLLPGTGLASGSSLGRDGAGDQALVGVDDVGLDHRPAARSAAQQSRRRLPRPRATSMPMLLQRSRDRRDVAQDLGLRARAGTGSPIARAASYEVCAGFTTKSVKLTTSSDRMIATIRVGSDGEHAAQQHQPHVQARARRAAPAIEPELRSAAPPATPPAPRR